MKNEIRNKIFDFAYLSALRDATLQEAFNPGKKGRKKTEHIPNEVREIVKQYIEKLLEVGVTEADFYNTAEKIDEKFHGTKDKEISDAELNKYFTFGNIQKLINMTTKYIFIACYADESLREKFENCHCPMDSIMMKKVKEEYLNLVNKNTKDEFLQIPLGNDKKSIDLSKTAWSKIGFREYDGPYSRSVYENFQEMVKRLANKEGVYPIEYDFLKWGE